ncbi:type II toxin-antitoxin system RelE/ParE family toxin [Prosthecobacter sp. SYSU 5D2]|uniref:type II toxin-antitoxin system RelE/ParE family toxin n=1 Tax=Prosthecobacter sp. SYSU 5D2 TaxID=3134134 RepID=UPI0031FEB950
MDDLVWTLAAENDVQAIYERLELREDGAGDLFYDEILKTVRLLQRFPLLGPGLEHRRLRRVLVYNRNYGLFYVSESRGVVLHALLDLRQAPEMIKRRLNELP